MLIHILSSCEEEQAPAQLDYEGEYSVTEIYEVIDGANHGLKGTSDYSMTVGRHDSGDTLIFKNLAHHDFEMKGVMLEDSFFIYKQYFLAYDSSEIIISGSGLFTPHSIDYTYVAGGRSIGGNIHAVCSGKR